MKTKDAHFIDLTMSCSRKQKMVWMAYVGPYSCAHAIIVFISAFKQLQDPQKKNADVFFNKHVG